MNSTLVSPALPDRWSVLARSTDVRCMAVVSLLSLAVLFYFIATLHEVVARGPWKPVAIERPAPTVEQIATVAAARLIDDGLGVPR
ncbi:hypothetical protein [Aquabacterium sp.]|uniref:hypothetical protein n=1 Tax=Aquabacterium sp. TaxID=1872578 RepID=UPI002BC1893C|nr:hypothetical protein [Aquabacterium sp.]HSW04613.1 hypothetical protein [Aquabacterium sp.]